MKKTIFSILFLTLLLSCSNKENWPTYGGNIQCTGDANTTGPKIISNIKWKFNAIGDGQGEDVDWFFKGVNTQPIIYNGLVLFGGGDSCFYAVDFETGEKRWSFKTNSLYRTTSATANNDNVFFTNYRGVAYNLAVNTGELLWSFTDKEDKDRFRGTGTDSSPLINDSIVVFKTGRTVFGFNIHNGEKLWRIGLRGLVSANVSVSYSNGLLFYSPVWVDDYLYCSDIETGQEKWRCKLEGLAGASSVDKGVLYFVCSEDLLHALDIYTGQELWCFKKEGLRINKPAISNDIVYISGIDYIYAINRKTGQEKWNLKMEDSFCSDIVVAEELLYVTNNRSLIAINKNTGQKVWDFKTNEPISSSPIVANGVVIFSCRDGFVYALE